MGLLHPQVLLGVGTSGIQEGTQNSRERKGRGRARNIQLQESLNPLTLPPSYAWGPDLQQSGRKNPGEQWVLVLRRGAGGYRN